MLTVTRKIYDNKNPNINCKSILKNYYKFILNPDNYFFVYNDFFELNFSNELKGFLLVLKAICLNNSNVYTSEKSIKGSVNKSELKRLLNMNIKTIEVYLNMAIEQNQIVIIDNHIIVKSDLFPIRVNKKEQKFEKRKAEILNTILKVCNKCNIIMPLVKEKYLDRILLYYYQSEDSIREINNDDYTKKYSLEYKLDNRINQSHTQINIEYILKILNIPQLDKKEKIKYEFIL